MSARLLGLAFDADVPSQTAKLVLVKLVDCADDSGRRIYPSVATLARAACCAERSVQRVLALFCAAGLLRRVREGGSGPGNTTHYELNLDLLARLTRVTWGVATGSSHDENACLPEDEPGGDAPPKGDIMSPLEPGRVTLATDKGDNRCHPTPQENPSNLREGGRERGQAGLPAGAGGPGPVGMTQMHGPPESDDPGAAGGAVPALSEFVRAWPTRAADNADRVATEWAALSFDQRRAAIDGIAAFLAEMKALKRDKLPAGETYLRERRWTLVSEASRAAARPAPQATTEVQAWTKGWWGVFWHRRATGAPVRFMWDRARQKGAFGATPAELAGAAALALVGRTLDTEDARAAMEKLRVDGLHSPFGRGDDKRWIFIPEGGI